MIAPALEQPQSITAADLDGDGDSDVLTAATTNSRVSWWVNNTDTAGGDWTELVIGTGPPGANSVVAADLDGDGDFDVLRSAAGSNDSLQWWENDGSPDDGGWIQHTMATGLSFYGVSSADIDSDGDLDVIYTVKATNGLVVWRENDGSPADGGWIEHVLASNLAGAITATARDLDMDGDLDIVAGGDDAPGEIRWWQSDGSPGDGGWTEHLIVTGLGSVYDVVAADLDLDGDLDIVAGLRTEADIRWWESDGSPADGGWIEHVVTSVFSARDITVGDPDSDGDLDILGAGISGGVGFGLRWFESDGSPGDGGWIDCGAQCSEDLVIGNQVTIVPQPDADSVFMDFAGDPACLPDGVIDSGEAVEDLSCSIRFETKLIFQDGFESGDMSAWSAAVP